MIAIMGRSSLLSISRYLDVYSLGSGWVHCDDSALNESDRCVDIIRVRAYVRARVIFITKSINQSINQWIDGLVVM